MVSFPPSYDPPAAPVSTTSDGTALKTGRVMVALLNEDALAKDLIAGHGTLETMSGNRYGTVILPATSLLSEAALDRLHVFATRGGQVLFLGRTPSLIYGRTILDARASTEADFSWGSVVNGELPPTPTPPAQPPTSPPAAQVVPEAIAQAVSTAVPSPDVRMERRDPHLRYMRRRLKDADVYLFFNEGHENLVDAVTLKGAGKKVEMWDPQTGAIVRVDATANNGSVKVELALKPYETRVLVLR